VLKISYAFKLPCSVYRAMA